eukprot:s951_g31.t1
MESGVVKSQMFQLLESKGLTGKKLAVFHVRDAESIAMQVCMDMGLICEQLHVDLVEGFIQEARSEEPIQKRLRGDHSMDSLHFQLLQDRSHVLHPRPSAPSTSLHDVLTESADRPSRRRTCQAEQGEERARKETEQKEFWSRELYKELRRMDAPALEHLEHCVDERHIHLALAGRTRYNTLKRYVKTWRCFLQWLSSARGDAASPEIGDLVEYIFTRFDEPCGPTVPPLIVKAVVWIERTACLDPRVRIGESQVVASVRDYVVEVLSKGSAPTKRAPRYPVVMMEAFEHLVEDESIVLGLRVVSWVKLVKLWGSLRWDDVQKIVPKELKYFGGRMTTILRTTKTTGPTKRVQELPVCISEHAFISSPFWLKTGFDLVKKHAAFARDYLLPKLNDSLTGFRRAMATYNDISSYSAHVRRTLRRPGFQDEVIHSVMSTFWTEHSERATLPTGLALLQAPKDERDMLGRWKPDGSDTYLRMYNGVITRLQLRFAKAARMRDRTKILDERDIIESALSWITERWETLPDTTVERILSYMQESMETPMLAGWTPVEEEQHFGLPLFGLPPGEEGDVETERAEEKCDKQLREPLYVVVNNGNKCKRLHKSRGGCWMGREMNFKSSVEFHTMPSSEEYTHYCKVCWPSTGPGTVLCDSDSSSSTSSSRSADSTSDSDS